MSHARTLGLAAAGLGGIYFIGTQLNDFKTPGIKNIERRHTAAGGADSHTPAGGSKMGDEESTVGHRQETQKGGVGTKYFEDTHAQAKPEPSELGKKWNKTMHGNEQGRGTSVR